MAIANTATHYGSVARSFHWLTALLILTAIPLGLIANAIPIAEDTIAQKTLLFSLHKTVGVAAFFVALARILWALGQPRPAGLHPDRKAETFLAETVHWMLYVSLVAVPLSGWIHHAATTGFAPIWWPFGQSLPFVPVDFRVAEAFSALHWVFTKVLAVSLVLHFAGAVKHAVIDKDVTLTRMTRGDSAVPEGLPQSRHTAPVIAAFLLWIVALGAGSWLGLRPHDDAAPVAELAAPAGGEWLVQEGTLGIEIVRMGGLVQGSFDDWVAAIRFDRDAQSEIKGDVRVEIAIGSFQLGSFTDQALGAEFFEAETFPTALFEGPIVEDPNGDGYLVDGTLTLKGVSLPVTLPFSLQIDGDTATATGRTGIDRRDYGVGTAYDDPGALENGVAITIDLTATRLDL